MGEVGVEMGLESELLFSKEAAEFLGITMQRLNKLIQTGKIIPLKKNSSGTIFHISELVRRKEELKIFAEIDTRGPRMYAVDTKIKNEALNFAVLMNALAMTESHLEPLFDAFSVEHPIDESMIEPELLKEYSKFFSCDKMFLFDEYRKAEQAFSTLHKDDEIIKRGAMDYPNLLLQTEQAPRFLYVRGNKSLLSEKRTVAIVGSRKASEKAKEMAKRLAEILGKNGITVVSGLAKGIDVEAHVGALEKGFNTIAVIGTSLNQYYPSENKDVQLRIEKEGVVVSQFSPASKTQRWFFPLRNGVMSGLSLATVIVEAGETSGALKQADFALKQGRQVIIPESALKMEKITWPQRYLQKGAKRASSATDVLRILAGNDIFKVRESAFPEQQTLFDYLDKYETEEKKNEDVNVEWISPVLK